MFRIVVCGCTGGPMENNLSCYLVSPHDKDTWVALDAGTLLSGIAKAIAKGSIKGHPEEFLKDKVVAYLISHSHLDHVLGLVINSQSDKRKPILGRDVAIDALRDHLFNGSIWPNFGNEGKNPLGLYTYQRVTLFEKTPLANSEMSVETLPLSHDDHCQSSAFLIHYKDAFLLYFGDTAPDKNGKGKLYAVWEKIAPLIREGKLKGMLLECSYPAGSGGEGGKFHLDTTTFMKEMQRLHDLAGSLKGLSVIVAHRKESLNGGPDPREQIAKELTRDNQFGLHFIFPEQGDLISF